MGVLAAVPLAYDRELCADVLATFVGALLRSLRQRAKRALGLRSVGEAESGAVTFVQRCDSSLRLNVHFHTLALDGVYVREESSALLFKRLPETGWREDKKRAWMWVFATSVVTLFVIARSRGRKVLEQALEGFKGRLVSDRWSPYVWVDVTRRQLCWAHLARDFQGMLERATEPELVHVQVLVDGVDTMFRWWHKLREDKMTRRGFRRCMSPLRERMEEALAALAEDGSYKSSGKAEEIWKLRQALWTFVDNEGIEPTNNLAERQLRHAVVWRKCSYGTDSPAGSRFVEAVLTVVLTARQQGRNALELLGDYVYAHFYQLDPPRLVPDSCTQA